MHRVSFGPDGRNRMEMKNTLVACLAAIAASQTSDLRTQDWRERHPGSPSWFTIGDPATERLLQCTPSGTQAFDGVAMHRSPHQWPRQSPAQPFVDWSRRRVQWGDPSTGFSEWIDGAWIPRPGSAGGPSGANCVYDTVRQRIVAFRRVGAQPAETWEFDGAAWHRVFTTAWPSAEFGYSMVFDEARRRTMLFGGYHSPMNPIPTGDCWVFDGVDWSYLGGNAPHGLGMVTYDRRAGAVIVFSTGVFGAPTAFYGYSGAWSGIPWPGSPATFGPMSLVSDPSTGAAVVADAVSLFEWRGTAWIPRGPAPRWLALQTPPFSQATVTDLGRRRVVLVRSDGTSVFETWEWDGASWGQAQPAHSPSPRHRQRMAYDATRQRVVLFGGLNVLGAEQNDLHEWDGTDWLQRTSTHAPPTPLGTFSNGNLLGYHPLRGVTLYTGTHQVWHWDGVDWSQASSGVQPQLSGMAWDASRNRFVGYAAWSGDLYELVATGWTRLPTAGCTARPVGGELVTLSTSGLVIYASAAPHVLAGNCWQPLPASASPVGPPYTEDPASGGVLATGDGTWVYSFVPAQANIQGVGCPAAGAPRLRASNQPQLGRAFALTVGTDGLLASPILIALDSRSGLVPLGHGCAVYLSGFSIVLLVAANASGAAWIDLPLPAVGAARGLHVHAQAVSLSGANPLGLALSNGLRLRLGD